MRWSDTRGDAGSWKVSALVQAESGKTVESEIPCRVNSCPPRRRLRGSIPLITAKPYLAASTKDEAIASG
jgi:hypothetical protein